MTQKALKMKKLNLPSQEWTPEKFKAFGDEIYAIQNEIAAKMGQEDVDYITKVRNVSRFSEILGRFLIHVSLDPLTWSAGIFSLWIHKQLETTEIGHSALHGCWDGLKGAEIFYSANFKWDTPVEEASWKKGHNELHHNYTNVVGRDPDLNYGPLRVTEKTPWSPFHLLQTGLFFVTAPVFTWTIALHATGLTDLNHPQFSEGYTNILPDRKLKTIGHAWYLTAKKMVPYFLYNYTLFPLLAGPFWWKVLTGNFAADALRDIYTASTIYAGHFGEDLEYYDASYRPKGRGEWYKSQIEAAHDYKVPHFISLLCGALDYQIEHHLFPELPPNRLREVSPRVREICERYGVRYQRQSWGKNLKNALVRIAEMSVPPQGLKVLRSMGSLLGQAT